MDTLTDGLLATVQAELHGIENMAEVAEGALADHPAGSVIRAIREKAGALAAALDSVHRP